MRANSLAEEQTSHQQKRLRRESARQLSTNQVVDPLQAQIVSNPPQYIDYYMSGAPKTEKDIGKMISTIIPASDGHVQFY